MVFRCDAQSPTKMTNRCHGAHAQTLPRRSLGSGPCLGQCWGVAALHPTHSHSSHSPVPVALADVLALPASKGSCCVSQERPCSVQ